MLGCCSDWDLGSPSGGPFLAFWPKVVGMEFTVDRDVLAPLAEPQWDAETFRVREGTVTVPVLAKGGCTHHDDPHDCIAAWWTPCRQIERAPDAHMLLCHATNQSDEQCRPCDLVREQAGLYCRADFENADLPIFSGV